MRKIGRRFLPVVLGFMVALLAANAWAKDAKNTDNKGSSESKAISAKSGDSTNTNVADGNQKSRGPNKETKESQKPAPEIEKDARKRKGSEEARSRLAERLNKKNGKKEKSTIIVPEKAGKKK